MRIRLLFIPGESHGEMPTLVSAVDEYTEDIWGGIPDFFVNDIKEYPGARQVFIDLDDDVILAQFDPSEVFATWDWKGDER